MRQGMMGFWDAAIPIKKIEITKYHYKTEIARIK